MMRALGIGRLAACMWFAIFICDADASEGPSDALMKQYMVATENTVNAVRVRIRPLMSSQQQKALDRIVISVRPDSWDIYGVVAGIDDSPPTIKIPLGLIYLQDYIDSAAAAAEVGHIPQSKLVAYIHAVTDIVRRKSKRVGAEHRPISGLPDFPSFAGLSPSEWRRIELSKEYRAAKDAIKLSSFAFILIHEFWHHLNPGASLEEREEAADKFAVELGMKTDYNPMLAFYTFAFFAAVEGDQSLKDSKPGYPAPLCRGLFFFLRGWDQANSDEDFVKYAKSRGLWSKWQRAPVEIRQILADDGVTCGQSNVSDMAQTTSGIPQETQPGYSMRVRTWRPTPGQCNGVELELLIDDDHVASIANMIDFAPQDIGKLTEGEHRFSFKDINGYCIEPYPPYRTNRFVSGISCGGIFGVSRSKDLHIDLRTTMSGHILSCGLR